MNIYDVNARIRPIERVEASTSWEARKAYAERHGVHVTDVIARRVNVPASWPQPRPLQDVLGPAENVGSTTRDRSAPRLGDVLQEEQWPGTLQGQLLPPRAD
jgi:hypothetical protein